MAEMENDVSDCDECDDLVEEAYAYLLSKKNPEYASESRKRVIRRKATKLTFSGEGELLYKHKQEKGKVGTIFGNPVVLCPHDYSLPSNLGLWLTFNLQSQVLRVGPIFENSL